MYHFVSLPIVPGSLTAFSATTFAAASLSLAPNANLINLRIPDENGAGSTLIWGKSAPDTEIARRGQSDPGDISAAVQY